MGLENDAILSYLEDNTRFADLFNQLYFGGRQMVDAGELADASEVYHGRMGTGDTPRTRDIKKRLKSGKELKILAVESQSKVNYIMPWRVMDYDCREYGRQIAEVQRSNKNADAAGEQIYANAGERLSMVRKEERFAPVYTLCLYHGTDAWDGPRSLKDMMDFGEGLSESEQKEWEEGFADYPLRLVCVSDPMDCSGFQTSLGKLFAILPYRKDKKGLKEFLAENPAYRKMDEETAQTISVMMGIKKFSEMQERYRTGKEYDMCQAIEEMMEDSRMEGRVEGRAEGTTEIIDNIMKELQCSLEKACRIAGLSLPEYYQAKGLCRI